MHGVQVLLHAQLASSEWPTGLLQTLRDGAVQLAMWELRHQHVLTNTLAALSAGGIQPVLFKGTALAYSLYPNPALRSRGDTDLIVPVDAKEQAHALLTSLEFERSLGVSGEYVSYQASYVRRLEDGGTHTLDLHWKINNSELLSRLFSYEELLRDAEPLPRLCPHALGASRVHALMLACMHRATHRQNPYYVAGEPHHDPDRLIWLYDIHILAEQLSGSEWKHLARLAAAKGLRAVCLEGIQHASERFHTELGVEALAALAQPGTIEPAARYLQGGKLRQQWMDFCALRTVSAQLGLVGELLFPPADYMRAKFEQPSGWLPWLYLRRALNGVTKVLRA